MLAILKGIDGCTSFSLHCRSDSATAEMEELTRLTANPDEINIGDSDEDEGGADGGEVEEVPLGITRQVVPSAVFGSIPEEKQGEVLGAKERFAKRKK